MAETRQKIALKLNTDGRAIVYANNVQLETSPWDFRFRFRRFGDATQDSVNVDELAVVYMSPSQAKAFLSALARQVEKYESTHGQLPVVTGAQKAAEPKTTAPAGDIEEQAD